MTKGKRKRKRHGGGGHHPAAPDPAAVLDDLEARAVAIAEADAAAAGPLWGEAHKLLLKTPVDVTDAARVIAARDVEALQRLVTALRSGDTDAVATSVEDPRAEPAREVDPDTKKKAMRAFRKRLKLTRLDHESKLGVGPMTSGKKADFDAIMAPHEFADEVWEALVDEGQLERMGRGFYKLAGE